MHIYPFPPFWPLHGFVCFRSEESEFTPFPMLKDKGASPHLPIYIPFSLSSKCIQSSLRYKQVPLNNESKGFSWEKSKGVWKKVSIDREEAQEISDTKKAQEAHEDHSRVPRNGHGHAL